jgi:hypothetical protein
MSEKRSDPVRIVVGGAELSLTNPLPVNIGGIVPGGLPLAISEDWRVALFSDVTLNDSDKSFQVPLATEWEILWIWVELTTTATVGDRQLEIQIQDAASDVIAAFQVGITQGASLTNNYLIAISMPDLAALYDTSYLITPLPAGTFLSAQQLIRIWDNNAVAPAADDMVVKMQAAIRTI